MNTQTLIVEPYLNLESHRIYNPITDIELLSSDKGYEELKSILVEKYSITEIPGDLRSHLFRDKWLIEDENDLDKRFFLKYVTIEANTACNQSCYFCPVSVNPRKERLMTMDFYEDIAKQLSVYKDTIEAVFMINFNEPTANKSFVDQIRILYKYGLVPALNTNATGLTKDRVDSIMDMGGLGFIAVNLSTIDRKRYKKERNTDHLPIVMKNLDYIKNLDFAQIMDIVVLGEYNDEHKRNFKEISEYFEGTNFTVRYERVMDRAGYLTVGVKPMKPRSSLCGCENVGSRPVQHINITASGECIICCEDFDESYVVGDLNKQTVDEVLTGAEMRKMRRWIYGVEASPENFICRKCIFSLPERKSFKESKNSFLNIVISKVGSLTR